MTPAQILDKVRKFNDEMEVILKDRDDFAMFVTAKIDTGSDTDEGCSYVCTNSQSLIQMMHHEFSKNQNMVELLDYINRQVQRSASGDPHGVKGIIDAMSKLMPDHKDLKELKRLYDSGDFDGAAAFAEAKTTEAKLRNLEPRGEA